MKFSVFVILGFHAVFVATMVLDLSFRGLRKEDFFLKLQSSINVHNVTDLNLRGNQFDSFLDCSTHLDSLQTLDLSQNHLKRFFFLCKDEYTLKYLNVSHNRLEYIDDNAINDRIPNLKILDLSDNKLFRVNETMLEHMKDLVFLSLAHNPILDGIHENAFQNLNLLETLNLRNVLVGYFSYGLFEPLKSLTSLDVSANPIEYLPTLPTTLRHLDISETFIIFPVNFVLPQLRVLLMNDMRNLTTLELNQFEDLPRLETLSAAHCRKLTELKIELPHNNLLLGLQRLHLQNCTLSALGEDLQPIMKRAEVLDLQNNPWNCDCHFRWVKELNITKELSSRIRCNSPEELRDKLLHDVSEYDLQCPILTSEWRVALWISFSILFLGVVGATAFFLARGPFTRWLLRQKRGDTVTYTNVIDATTHDLVRILNVPDTGDSANQAL